MHITFAILTWNRAVFLEKCLTSLFASIKMPAECDVIVMDNGSTDGTREVAAKFSSINYVKLTKNFGLNGYKKLLGMATGEIIVLIDDDVIEFPQHIDAVYKEYLEQFPEFGFLSLNVVQNEFTHGAKPPSSSYTVVEKDGAIIEEGPAGGWCAGFRRKDYRKIRWAFNLIPLNLKRCHDAVICRLMKVFLGRRAGVIQAHTCFHACGAHYAKLFGFLEHDIEKYRSAGLNNFVEHYEKMR